MTRRRVCASRVVCLLGATVLVCVGGSAASMSSSPEEGGFMTAMKNLLFGSEHAQNASSQSELIYPPPPEGAASFRQYQTGKSLPSGESCTLPRQIGTGPYRIPRWYYNPVRGRCELFYWSGCCGNGNNFQTFQNCQNTCEVNPQNPIQSQTPLFAEIELIFKPAPGTGPGAAHYLTATASSVGCLCCLRPYSEGYGSYLLPRYYYDAVNSQCRPFVYRGQGGYGNVFDNEQQCRMACSSTQKLQPIQPPVLVQPPALPPIMIPTTTTPAPQIQIQWVPTTPMPPPPLSMVPMTMTPYQEPVDPCSQDKEPGVGAQQIQRFYFNKDTRMCESFVYFGSAGNRNNFQKIEDCQQQCPGARAARRRIDCGIGKIVHAQDGGGTNFSNATNRMGQGSMNGHAEGNESPNPCAISTPITQMSTCNPGATCGGGNYCHVGANPQTTVCCPKPATADRCQQPLNQGIGNAQLPRWWYNQATQNCQPCTYRGLQGNENNFLSQNECENACLINPCRQGTPYKSQGVTVQCSAANPTVCPAGFYCHIGADQSTSVCCEALGNTPCEEEMTKGEGEAALTRFYYDIKQRKCLAFNYLGTKGNRNNFLTKESCEVVCPVWLNPCSSGLPIMGNDNKPFQCHKAATCPPGYFCHLGFDDSTTACCQSEGEPCTLIVKEGHGNHAIQRWFYNQQTRQCQPFTYRGMGGNENNFLFREHCETACPVFVNACPSGEPYLMPSGVPQLCDPTNSDQTCPTTHWCHSGPDSATQMCCPGRTDPCIHMMSEGEGPLSLPRWHFDAVNRQCVEFTFRGLKGNQNNFLTLEDCETRCPVQINPCPVSFSSLKHATGLKPCGQNYNCPSNQWCHVGETKDTTVCCPNAVPDPCLAPPRNPGIGKYRATRWAFDGKSRKCIPFEYRGMKGNANNFISREACEDRCPVFENPCKIGDAHAVNGQYFQCSPTAICPAGYYCHIGIENNYCCQALGGDPCGQPVDRGTGGAQLARWYWNEPSQCCLPFSYCGQKGTQNNFLSKQDCERTCYEIDNPCALGEPQMTVEHRPQQCSLISNTCANTYWCHFGANQDTTVCCPGRVSPDEICAQPLVEGEGEAQLQRWYYDPSTRQCLQFTYRGRFGNQNNFLTEQMCEQTCPVYVNVCPEGSPLLDETKRPVPCTFGSNSCGPDHWCHLGLLPAEYQCCPGQPTVPSACQGLPSVDGKIGADAAPQTRYFYDASVMQCEQFIYNGRQGNQNNFLTKEDCEATCKVMPNPCRLPISMPPQMCSAGAQPDTCGSTMWCHVGFSPETTVCCPDEGDPCQLPLITGTGGHNLERWYYNQQSGQCMPFSYCGMQGNQNNFLSREACEERCGPNPCFEGRPFTGADGRAQTCSSSANLNTCPASYWCHIGVDMSTTVCCPGASTNVCNLPMSTGEGNANLERYYYDSQAKTCRPFVYNGLKGNQNNFISLRACQLACQPLDNPCIGQPAVTAAGQVLFCSATNRDTCPVNFWCHIGATPETTVCCPGATNPCSVPLSPGTGNSGLPRYYYNPDDRQCIPFQYNGKRGNQNNFLSQTECERTCPVFTNPCLGEVIRNDDGAPRECDPFLRNSCGDGAFCLPSTHNSYCCSKHNQDICDVLVSSGQGSSNLTRYYYNSIEGQCLAFEFKGNLGNENNFITKTVCEENCAPLSNVCFGGESPLIVYGKIVQCHGRACPPSHFCHRGLDQRSTVCCRKQGSPCEQQLMTGVGNGNLLRFYYDSYEDACLPFNYTGIGGNENNFFSLTDCQIKCPGYRDFCPHGRPQLNNSTFVPCGIDKPCSKGYICHVSNRDAKSVCCPDPAAFCALRIEPGPCSGSQRRFAYDKATGACKKFSYGGCEGNLNNFDSFEKCTKICCEKGYYN